MPARRGVPVGTGLAADALFAAAGRPLGRRRSGKSAAWRRACGGDKDGGRVACRNAVCAVTTGDPLARAVCE